MKTQTHEKNKNNNVVAKLLDRFISNINVYFNTSFLAEIDFQKSLKKNVSVHNNIDLHRELKDLNLDSLYKLVYTLESIL